MKTEYLDDTENVVCPYCKHIVLNNEECQPYDDCEHVIFIATNEGGFEDIDTPYPERFNNSVQGDIDELTNCDDIDGIRIELDSLSGLTAYYGFEKPKNNE